MSFTFLIKSLFSSILARILPERTKRLVLLSSLYALVSGTTSFDSLTIRKLNKIMCLSTEDKALEFPMQLSSVIWRGDARQSVIYPVSESQSDWDSFITRIVDKVPKCLFYSDRQNIFKDISKLLSERGNLVLN